jgi:hypothetical protein
MTDISALFKTTPAETLMLEEIETELDRVEATNKMLDSLPDNVIPMYRETAHLTRAQEAMFYEWFID